LNSYTVAWIIAGLGAAGMLGSTFALFRRTRLRKPVLFVVLVLLVLLLVPAPVPGYPDNVAPAFAVAVFEAAFQDDGKPAVAVRILGVGLIAGILLASVLMFIARLLAHRRID